MSACFTSLKRQIMDQMEALGNELLALRCVSGLLNGQNPDANAVELSELSYLIDPIIEREKLILDDVRAMFKAVD